MSREHHLKCWPGYFESIKRGRKNFEVRRDDRGFEIGDILVLEKFFPDISAYELGEAFVAERDSCPKKNSVRRRIIDILRGGQFGIEAGYVVMGLEPADAAE